MLNPDYRDILSGFCEEKVEFLQDLADIARLEGEENAATGE